MGALLDSRGDLAPRLTPRCRSWRLGVRGLPRDLVPLPRHPRGRASGARRRRRPLHRPPDLRLVVRVVAARRPPRGEPDLHPRAVGSRRLQPRVGDERSRARLRLRAAHARLRPGARLQRRLRPDAGSLGLDGVSPVPAGDRRRLAVPRRRVPVRLLDVHPLRRADPRLHRRGVPPAGRRAARCCASRTTSSAAAAWRFGSGSSSRPRCSSRPRSSSRSPSRSASRSSRPSSSCPPRAGRSRD